MLAGAKAHFTSLRARGKSRLSSASIQNSNSEINFFLTRVIATLAFGSGYKFHICQKKIYSLVA